MGFTIEGYILKLHAINAIAINIRRSLHIDWHNRTIKVAERNILEEDILDAIALRLLVRGLRVIAHRNMDRLSVVALGPLHVDIAEGYVADNLLALRENSHHTTPESAGIVAFERKIILVVE